MILLFSADLFQKKKFRVTALDSKNTHTFSSFSDLFLTNFYLQYRCLRKKFCCYVPPTGRVGGYIIFGADPVGIIFRFHALSSEPVDGC